MYLVHHVFKSYYTLIMLQIIWLLDISKIDTISAHSD